MRYLELLALLQTPLSGDIMAYLLLIVLSRLSCQHEEVVLSLMGIVLSLQLVNDVAAESQQKRAGVKRFAGSSSGEENEEEEEEEEEEGEESRGAPLGKQRKKVPEVTVRVLWRVCSGVCRRGCDTCGRAI